MHGAGGQRGAIRRALAAAVLLKTAVPSLRSVASLLLERPGGTRAAHAKLAIREPVPRLALARGPGRVRAGRGVLGTALAHRAARRGLVLPGIARGAGALAGTRVSCVAETAALGRARGSRVRVLRTVRARGASRGLLVLPRLARRAFRVVWPGVSGTARAHAAPRWAGRMCRTQRARCRPEHILVLTGNAGHTRLPVRASCPEIAFAIRNR